jgi:hypothetical protein
LFAARDFPYRPDTSTGSTHASNATGAFTQGHAEIRSVSLQARRERHAPAQARYAEERPQWGEGEIAQAGHRHWSLRGAREGREGTEEAFEQRTVEFAIRFAVALTVTLAFALGTELPD